MVQVFREVWRVLRDDGTVFLNLGDSYYNYRPGGTSQTKQTLAKHDGEVVAVSGKRGNKLKGLKEKDLIGIPWRVALALQADGWYLRSDIIWHKPNPMPESVRDRPTKSHEYIFLLSKNKKYYYDAEAIKENKNGKPDRRLRKSTFKKVQKIGKAQSSSEYVETIGRNKRSVWTVATSPYKDAHFATYPPKLIEPCILAGCPENGTVLDPFFGSGTTGQVAIKHNRRFVGLELNPEYIGLAKKRTSNVEVMLL